jgi:hypothetical protein
MEEKEIIEKAIRKHNLKLDVNDPNIQSLVRYAKHVGYSEGYNDRNMEELE